MKQVFEQTGTGFVLQYAYALVSNMNPEPDFEAGSLTQDVLMTLQLVPIEIDGKTVYSPQQIGD